jgi:hypothetical protein
MILIRLQNDANPVIKEKYILKVFMYHFSPIPNKSARFILKNKIQFHLEHWSILMEPGFFVDQK